MNTKEKILCILSTTKKKMAVHEFGLQSISENNLATRLSELAKIGKVSSQYREGKRYKEWFISKLQQGELI